MHWKDKKKKSNDTNKRRRRQRYWVFKNANHVFFIGIYCDVTSGGQLCLLVFFFFFFFLRDLGEKIYPEVVEDDKRRDQDTFKTMELRGAAL